MYFSLMKSRDDQFYFVGLADNHEKIFTSETYKNRQDAVDTMNLIKKESSAAEINDFTKLSV